MWQHLTTNIWSVLQKNKLNRQGNKMISSNNNNYVSKSYLNVFKWVADKMQGV